MSQTSTRLASSIPGPKHDHQRNTGTQDQLAPALGRRTKRRNGKNRAVSCRKIRSPSKSGLLNNAASLPSVTGLLQEDFQIAAGNEWTNKRVLPNPSSPSLSKASSSTRRQESIKTSDDAFAQYGEWHGNQPEDVLTEQVIRDGYSCKPKFQNEMATARSSLWPHLKAGTSMANLSSAFICALQQRTERDVITAASTFKPPPRVTLTDSRKTAWLSELADDSVPLRRLSRTIPHGFRGRSLLEQCLQNRVPIARTMWLVRCVGANELRAFRRKGVSDATVVENESKWISEWTGHVDRFLSDPTRGRPAEYSDYHYALQITARIFSEGLVDRDEFLAKLCDRLSTSAFGGTPFALLKVAFWLSSLISSFKHCIHAVQALYQIFEQLSMHPQQSGVRPVLDRIVNLASRIATQQSLAFMSFGCTQMRSSDFTTLTGLEARQESVRSADYAMAHSIDGKAQHLETVRVLFETLENSLIKNPVNPEHRIKAIIMQPDIELSSYVSAFLSWATSAYRSRHVGIYAFLRLVPFFRKDCADFNSCLIRAIDQAAYAECTSCDKLGHLVIELIRESYLEIGSYLKWLVSTGAMYASVAARQAHSAILDQLPVQRLPPGLRSLLRQIRGRHIDHSDYQGFGACRLQYVRVLENVLQDAASGRTLRTWGEERPRSATWSETFNVTSTIARCMIDAPLDESDPLRSRIGQVGEVLCMTNDVIIVAKFVRHFAVAANADQLISLIVAVSAQAESIAALGVLEDLRILLIRRYHGIMASDSCTNQIVRKLTELMQIEPANEHLENHMAEQLRLLDQRPGIAAYTPMSDLHLAADAEAQADEIYDFLKGTLTPEKLAVALSTHVAKQTLGAAAYERLAASASVAMERLSDFSAMQMGTAMLNCALEVDASDNATAQKYMAFIFMYEVLPFAGLFMVLATNLEMYSILSAMVLEFLADPNHVEAILGIDCCLNNRHVLSLTTRIRAAQKHQAATLTRMVSQVLNAPADLADSQRRQRLLQSDFVTSLIRNMLLSSPQDATAIFQGLPDDTLPQQPRDELKSLILRQIDPTGTSHLADKPLLETIAYMFQHGDQLAIPIFQACLPFLAKLASPGDAEADDSRQRIKQLISAALSSHRLDWANVLHILPPALDVAVDIRAAAEEALFAHHDDSAAPPPPPMRDLPRPFLLEVVRATARSIPPSGDPATASRILTLLDRLANVADPSAATHDLLHLALLHKAAFGPHHPTRLRLLTLLARHAPLAASSAHTAPALAAASTTLLHATLGYFTLSTPQATLSALLASLSHAQSADPSLRFLLSIPPTPAPLFLRSQAPVAPPTYQNAAPDAHSTPLGLATSASSTVPAIGSGTGPGTGTGTGPGGVPFSRSAWELIPDAGGEDAAVGLRLFGARKVA